MIIHLLVPETGTARWFNKNGARQNAPESDAFQRAKLFPAQTAKNVIEQLRSKGVVTRGALGVEVQPVTAEIGHALGVANTKGALVAQAEPGGPASRPGI